MKYWKITVGSVFGYSPTFEQAVKDVRKSFKLDLGSVPIGLKVTLEVMDEKDSPIDEPRVLGVEEGLR